MNDRDRFALENILEQCEIIKQALERHQLSPEVLSDDGFLYNACCMSIFEIGEEVKKLSRKFVEDYPEQQWNEIAKMRDKIGHHYGDLNVLYIWKVVTEDIEKLAETCKKGLDELSE